MAALTPRGHSPTTSPGRGKPKIHGGERIEGRIYVGGLPRTLARKDVHDVFAKWGAVEEVQLHVQLFQEERTQFAFVQFDSDEVAKRAIEELTGDTALGPDVVVDFAKEPNAAKAEHSMKDSSKILQTCVFFAQGICKNGDNCKFSHSEDGVRVRRICKFYAEGAFCTDAEFCPYMHLEDKLGRPLPTNWCLDFYDELPPAPPPASRAVLTPSGSSSSSHATGGVVLTPSQQAAGATQSTGTEVVLRSALEAVEDNRSRSRSPAKLKSRTDSGADDVEGKRPLALLSASPDVAAPMSPNKRARMAADYGVPLPPSPVRRAKLKPSADAQLAPENAAPGSPLPLPAKPRDTRRIVTNSADGMGHDDDGRDHSPRGRSPRSWEPSVDRSEIASELPGGNEAVVEKIGYGYKDKHGRRSRSRSSNASSATFDPPPSPRAESSSKGETRLTPHRRQIFSKGEPVPLRLLDAKVLCPERHRLVPLEFPTGLWCDHCKKDVEKDEVLWECAQCSYDLCQGCVSLVCNQSDNGDRARNKEEQKAAVIVKAEITIEDDDDQAVGNGESSQPCFWFSEGRCRNGAACAFSHDAKAWKPICEFWASGECLRGQGCPFRHEWMPGEEEAWRGDDWAGWEGGWEGGDESAMPALADDPASSSGYSVGQKVDALWPDDDTYLPAFIDEVYPDGTFRVRWEDDSLSDQVPLDYIKPRGTGNEVVEIDDGPIAKKEEPEDDRPGPPDGQPLGFLPLAIRDCTILMKEGENQWRLTNRSLKSPNPGVVYRNSKDLEDRTAYGETWGTLLSGEDVGDGWVHCLKRLKD